MAFKEINWTQSPRFMGVGENLESTIRNIAFNFVETDQRLGTLETTVGTQGTSLATLLEKETLLVAEDPIDLEEGQLAFNETNGKLFIGGAEAPILLLTVTP